MSDAYEPPRDPSGFYLSKGVGPTAIFIESDRIEECMAYYREHDLSEIAMSSFMGFDDEDLDFLRDHPYVRGVWLSDAKRVVDISGLTCLHDLETLGISDNAQPIDLAQFIKLREFRAEWHRKMRITSDCAGLRILDLSKYKPKSKDLSELAGLPALEDLSIVQSPLTSIAGVGRFRSLRRLELSYLTKLESIEAIRELKDGFLETLDCDVCRKIRDHDAVQHLRSLRLVKFNSCGEIPTLGFLDDMPNLEEFRFVHTNVLDGDLRPLLRLKSVGFFKKKHYSHTPEQVDAIIAGNATASK